MKAIQRKRLSNIGGGFYDSAKVGDQRSNFWIGFPLTGEKEFTAVTRINSLRKIRAVEANMGFIGAMKGKVGRYEVGRGLFPIPQTRDIAWNIATAQRFDEWASNPNVCDVSRMMNYWEMQRWNAETMFTEAETFTGLVNSKRSGSPQLQMFDNGEIEYSPGNGGAPGSGEDVYWDGCKMAPDGTIEAYMVRTEEGGGWKPVEAHNMIHLCERKRPNQVRAITPFHATINGGLDAMDMRALENASRKLHSFLAMVVNKDSGPGVGAGGLTGTLQSILSASPVGDNKGGVEVNNAIGEQIYGGGAIAHLGDNEKIQLLTSAREFAPVMQWMEWLMRDMSNNRGIPFEFAWNMSELGGADSRIVLADGQWFFDAGQDKINDGFNYRVWVWWLSIMFQRDWPYPDDADWWKVEWMGPPKLTADAGKQMMAEIAALQAGFGTWQDYYEARGKNWKPKTTQRFTEVAFAWAESVRLKPADFPGDAMAFYNMVYPPKAGAAAAAPMGSSGGDSPDPGSGGAQA